LQPSFEKGGRKKKNPFKKGGGERSSTTATALEHDREGKREH
jgi:hypothetical protein